MTSISPSEFSKLMAGFNLSQKPTLAIATSGGADSMCLLLLAHSWAKISGAKIISLTVDHGLRAEAKAEAAFVANWCSQHSIPYHTLTWQHSTRPTAAIQEQARDARYELLTQWCKKNNVNYLLTAHHANDQAETFFFRLARGSGLDGLACMQPISKLGNVTLLRPLLPFTKSALVAYLKSQNQTWMEDPSNIDMRYTRARIRHLLGQTGDENGIAERVTHITQKLSTFRKSLENNLASKLTLCITHQSIDSTTLSLKHFREQETEYGKRMLATLIQKIGGQAHKPRAHKLEHAYSRLTTTPAPKRLTLGGCTLTLRAKTGELIIARENRDKLITMSNDFAAAKRKQRFLRTVT